MASVAAVTPAPAISEIVGARPEPVSAAVSNFIHMARWLAAFVVLLCHVAAALVSVPDIMTAPHNPLAYAWWFLTPYAFAHEAVVVFFVLSGFLVGGAVWDRRNEQRPWLRGYLIDRIVRIYIVLVPVLALTYLFDTTGRALFSGDGIYDLPEFADRYTPWLILPNLLSLQGLWFEPYGSNDPLWSLGMEVWYYVLFPLLLLPWLKAYPQHWRRVFGLAFAIVFLLSLPAGNYTAFGFGLWLVGVLARHLPRPLLGSRWIALLLFVAVSVVVRLAVRPPLILNFPAKHLVDATEALLFGNLLLTLRFDATDGFALARNRIHTTLASFSYTLYAYHMPVLLWILGAVGLILGADWRRQPATAAHYVVAMGVILLLGVFGWVLSLVTEARTEGVRRRLKRRTASAAP